jgi:hypothetical protein
VPPLDCVNCDKGAKPRKDGDMVAVSYISGEDLELSKLYLFRAKGLALKLTELRFCFAR